MLNKKFYKSIPVLANISSDPYIFLGGSNNTIQTFFNSSELTANTSAASADQILINEGSGFITYYYFSIAQGWYRQSPFQSANTKIIANNSLVAFKSPLSKTFTMQGTNLIQKFSNLGKVLLNKPNLSKLKALNFDSNGIYIFKSAITNLLGTIFNQAEMGAYTDALTIYTEGSLTGASSIFYTDGSTWVYDDYSTNADNYVIPANSILIFSTANDINITIGGGAIVQKLNSGKFQIQKTYFDNFNLLTTTSVLAKLKLNGFPTFGQLFGGAAFINNNNGQNIDNIFLFNGNFVNLIEFLDENLQSIAVYFPYAGSFYDAVSLDEYTDNNSISIGGVWNNKQNVIPTYLVTSKGDPLAGNTIIKLFNNNLAKVVERF